MKRYCLKLDLKDDTDAAISLFQLVNIIAQQMISNPKHADEVYATLPESKRKEIEKRDAKPWSRLPRLQHPRIMTAEIAAT